MRACISASASWTVARLPKPFMRTSSAPIVRSALPQRAHVLDDRLDLFRFEDRAKRRHLVPSLADQVEELVVGQALVELGRGEITDLGEHLPHHRARPVWPVAVGAAGEKELLARDVLTLSLLLHRGFPPGHLVGAI